MTLSDIDRDIIFFPNFLPCYNVLNIRWSRPLCFRMSTIVFGGFSGVGKRSIITRMLEIGSSTITRESGSDDQTWNLRTKYFTAQLIPQIAEDPSELCRFSETVFEVRLIVLY
jgi:hypothetical protein